MSGKYKWDIEALNGQIQQLRQEKEKLENSKQFFYSLKAEVQENWLSLAGSKYTDSLEMDIQLYARMLAALEGSITMLDMIVNQTYLGCEYEVKKRVMKMASDMMR